MSLRLQLIELKLGMNQNLISLMPHEASWSTAFKLVESCLHDLISDGLELHHIGSTSISGINAKPILDVLGVVSSIEAFDLHKNKLESMGFVWKGEFGIANRRYCVLSDPTDELTLLHLHVFEKTNTEVEKHLVFRDYLKNSPRAAKRYEDLKLSLANSSPKDRSIYSERKSELISHLLAEAYQWRQNSYDLNPASTLQSLAYQTDLSILAFQGRVTIRDEYIVAESPENPGYFWGNLLVMRKAPTIGDYDKWTSHFKKEFSHSPLVKHMTFGWDSTDGNQGFTAPFIENDFEVESSVVLTLKKAELLKTKHNVNQLEVRPLLSDDDWEAAIQNQVACRQETFTREAYLNFKRIQMKKYRDMSTAGLGHWFGAFLNAKLIADCGLYCFNNIGRYQAVGTHPDFRKRGVCGNLIYESAQFGFEKLGTKTLVMVAEPAYHAAQVYESVGFKPSEKAVGMYKYPKDEWSV